VWGRGRAALTVEGCGPETGGGVLMDVGGVEISPGVVTSRDTFQIFGAHPYLRNG